MSGVGRILAVGAFAAVGIWLAGQKVTWSDGALHVQILAPSSSTEIVSGGPVRRELRPPVATPPPQPGDWMWDRNGTALDEPARRVGGVRRSR